MTVSDQSLHQGNVAASAPPALAIEGLSHKIGGKTILDSVNIAVPAGQFVVLLGQNGAGKTTLFSLVTRLYTAQAGSIGIFGHDLRRESSVALSQLGVVFQQRALDPDLSANQNLWYHAALHGMPWGTARRRIAEELARVGLADHAKRKVRGFSGGEARRVEIARALLHNPHLLLCDEATVGLDIRSRADIMADVRGLVRERSLTVLWATHLIDEVQPDDLTIILHRGKVLNQGPACEIIASVGATSLNDAFRRITEGRPHEGLEMTGAGWMRCFIGIVWREGLRFIQQRSRFVSALVRPLIWLFVFAAGFRSVLGVSIIPPYETYILYDEYIIPGLIAMIQLFNGMQSSLSMVYDREVGSMRVLLTSPVPRWFLLVSKLIAGTLLSLPQIYVFLLIAYFYGIVLPPLGYIAVIPALILSGLMLGALGLLLSSMIRQLENFAGVMNFIIFPMFFASSALYPLWKVEEASPLLHDICAYNPFTYAVESIRFMLYEKLDPVSMGFVAGFLVVFLGGAIAAYDPAKGLIARVRTGGAGA